VPRGVDWNIWVTPFFLSPFAFFTPSWPWRQDFSVDSPSFDLWMMFPRVFFVPKFWAFPTKNSSGGLSPSPYFLQPDDGYTPSVSGNSAVPSRWFPFPFPVPLFSVLARHWPPSSTSTPVIDSDVRSFCRFFFLTVCFPICPLQRLSAVGTGNVESFPTYPFSPARDDGVDGPKFT